MQKRIGLLVFFCLATGQLIVNDPSFEIQALWTVQQPTGYPPGAFRSTNSPIVSAFDGVRYFAQESRSIQDGIITSINV